MDKIRLRHVFQLAISIKEHGAKFYNELAKKVSDARVKKLCTKLANDEGAHKQVFQDILSLWDSVPVDNRMSDLFVKEIKRKGFFQNPPPHDTAEEDMIKYAIEQDRKIANYFVSFEKSFSEDWKKMHLQKIVDKEKEHEKRLEKLLKMEKLEYKKYILAVDDEPENLKLIAAMFSKKGYRVVPVESGDEAIRYINIEKPDLVFLDIMMPERDGIQILQEIKEIDKDIPVVMLTAVWDDKEAEKCKSLGAYEYVHKPIDFENLNKIVLKIFSSN